MMEMATSFWQAQTQFGIYIYQTNQTKPEYALYWQLWTLLTLNQIREVATWNGFPTVVKMFPGVVEHLLTSLPSEPPWGTTHPQPSQLGLSLRSWSPEVWGRQVMRAALRLPLYSLEMCLGSLSCWENKWSRLSGWSGAEVISLLMVGLFFTPFLYPSFLFAFFFCFISTRRDQWIINM